MSCEESYLAILRYLTNERKPYAPGTPDNTKRKIRKAAACYVVRDGTLFYQRRLKGHKDFAELEVVLQDGRRRQLIAEAHVMEGGEHFNQQLTWELISQKYWWRGILKHVKDHIRECAQCQSRRGADDGGSGPRPFSRLGRRKVAANDDEDAEEEEEEDGDESLLFCDSSSSQMVSRLSKGAAKHELVFVDSKGKVNQFLPRHSQTMLDKLNQQRLSNQFCDITLLIEGEEFRAHKAVLAACSEYFNELFFEKGAATTHEAVVDLSGFTKCGFLPLLDFAYTSTLTFNFCIMAEIANLARHLLMTEVLQICESVHKQVEEQKLTVYQQGDVHTVVSSQLAAASKDEASDAYVVTIESDGSVVTHGAVALSEEGLAFVAPSKEVAAAYLQQPVAVVAQSVEGGKLHGSETVALIAHGGHAEAGETVTLISGAAATGLEGETMTVVTHSGQAGASESLAVVSACLAMEQPQVTAETETFIMNVDKASPTEGADLPPAPMNQEASGKIEVAEVAPAPPKRKRGRPAKLKKEVEVAAAEELVAMEEEDPSVDESHADKQEASPDDPRRRRLRQRSIGEGGYARLHMGLEDEEEGKKVVTPPRAATPKVAAKLGRRGRPPKQRDEPQAEPASEPDAEPEAVPTEPEATGELNSEAGLQEVEPCGGSKQESGAADAEHTCSECGMIFPRRYSLIMHMLKHEKARGYKCSLCNKEFQYAASLRAHLARHKQQNSQRAQISRAPSEHVVAEQRGDGGGAEDEKTSSPHTRREFVCDICGKTLPKLYSLRIHMLSHTGVRPHCCKVCGKAFAHKHSLKMHRALHDASKQFQCQYCKRAFVSKRSMEEHTSVHTGESKYLCNTCGATFHRASALSKHLKKHQPKPDVRPFACAHCDKRFYEAKDLQQHMNKHMGLKPFQCQVCGKCYSWKKDWYSHVKSHSVAEPFKCNVCGKEFFEKALFRRHVKKATHGKKGRVKQNLERECEQCGRKFMQLREYRRHVNNHQGVKPFECLTCGVAWADARSLKRHVRTHTGERPYVCPICQEAHIDARTLRKHMAKYHVDNLPGKIMLEKDTLQFHNQGTQVEHAVSILASDLPPELRPPAQPPTDDDAAAATAEEIETVLITEETVEAVEAVQAVQAAAAGEGGVATLSDQGIMQVVNYVLAQQAKMEEAPEVIQTMEVEVAHVAEVE
ncbi:unnamed protein product [Ophioblennius macclurei]